MGSSRTRSEARLLSRTPGAFGVWGRGVKDALVPSAGGGRHNPKQEGVGEGKGGNGPVWKSPGFTLGLSASKEKAVRGGRAAMSGAIFSVIFVLIVFVGV